MIQDANSIEAVAYDLFLRICYSERRDVGIATGDNKNWDRPDRHWILSTYAECLRTVKSGQAGATATIHEAQEKYSGWRSVPREAILASDPV